jgi:hypothetical protein
LRLSCGRISASINTNAQEHYFVTFVEKKELIVKKMDQRIIKQNWEKGKKDILINFIQKTVTIENLTSF